MNNKKIDKELLNVPFGLGKDNPLGEYFSGKTYMNILHNKNLDVKNVTYEKGGRTSWHIHLNKKDGGQLILITYGEGIYQEENKDPIKLKAGDYLYVPPNVKHWHGATSKSNMSHVSIFIPGVDTEHKVIEKVSEEDYLKANKFLNI